jgi:hypothetical protein
MLFRPASGLRVYGVPNRYISQYNVSEMMGRKKKGKEAKVVEETTDLSETSLEKLKNKLENSLERLKKGMASRIAARRRRKTIFIIFSFFHLFYLLLFCRL